MIYVKPRLAVPTWHLRCLFFTYDTDHGATQELGWHRANPAPSRRRPGGSGKNSGDLPPEYPRRLLSEGS